jgi:hypothetical protein
MTMQAAPKTEELGNNINYFFDNNLRPAPLEILRLKKEAENLLTIDAVSAYNYLSRIAVLENNRKTVISNYKKSIKLVPNNYVTHFNYPISLARCGLHDLALKKARENVKMFSNDKNVLKQLLSPLIFTARFNEARELLNKIEDKTQLQFINHAARIFDEANLTDGEAQHLQTLAYSVIEKNNLYYFEPTINIIDDCVCFTLYVDLPVEEIFDINWELAGVLADNVEDMRCGVLNFEYSSIEVLRERREYERRL